MPAPPNFRAPSRSNRPRRQSGRPRSDPGASGDADGGRDRPDRGPLGVAATPAMIHPDDPAQSYPEFLNGAVLVRTTLAPEAILAGLHAIEARLGRDRSRGDGALAATPDRSRPGRRRGSGAYGRQALQLPHPEMHGAISCWHRSARSGPTGATRCSSAPRASCCRRCARLSDRRCAAGNRSCIRWAAVEELRGHPDRHACGSPPHPSGRPPGWRTATAHRARPPVRP